MIDTFFNMLRKVFVGMIALVFAFVVIYVPQPFNHIDEAEAFPDPSTALLATKELKLDAIANILAKSLVTAMTTSIVQWINNGFEGSPAFLSDIDGFLLNVADEAAGEFIASISKVGSFICSPFQLDIQIALAVQYQATREGQPYRGCRLSDLSGNLEDFLAGEFSQGGWQDWFAIVAEPQLYTPYGQLLTAQEGYRASIRNAQGKELTQTGWGDGFLSGKLCEVIEGSDGDDERCVISKPGTVIANSLNKALGAGQDALIAADEINEIISALLGQIAVQALTGTAGLLGLSRSVQGGGGSFLDRTNQQSLNQVTTSAAGSIAEMTTTITIQQQVNQLAIQYIPRLQAFAADSNNSRDQRNQATDAEAQARQARGLSQANIERINPLLADYRALEAQVTASGTTLQRQQEIKQEQLLILTAFYQIPIYIENDLRAFRRDWEAALRP